MRAERIPEYATPDDYRQVFGADNLLHWTAYVLTGDAQTAEECLVSGLADCFTANGVFRSWAESWARRMIIKNAARLMPSLTGSNELQMPSKRNLAFHPAGITERLLQLQVFDRFIVIMAILEGYKEQECAVLLQCTREQVAEAKARLSAAFFLDDQARARIHDEALNFKPPMIAAAAFPLETFGRFCKTAEACG